MDMSVKLSSSYPGATSQAAGASSSVAQPKVETVLLPEQVVREPKRTELEQAVTDIRDFVQATQRNLDFSIDDSTGKVVVKVIATQSGEVIRQIPSESALKLAQSLSEASSLLFDTNV